MNAVTGTAPDIAILIHTETVGESGRDGVKHAALRQTGAVTKDIENTDIPGWVGGELRPAFGYIEVLFIWRKIQTVRSTEVVRHYLQAAIGRVVSVKFGGNSGVCLPPS